MKGFPFYVVTAKNEGNFGRKTTASAVGIAANVLQIFLCLGVETGHFSKFSLNKAMNSLKVTVNEMYIHGYHVNTLF